MMRPLILLISVSIVTSSIVGCSTYYAPVSRKDMNNAPGSGQVHQVVKGDTLYAIALRYDKDYREIADLNHIKAPYMIYPGQLLQLSREQISAANLEAANSKEADLESTSTLNSSVTPIKANKTITSQTQLRGKVGPGKIKWYWPVDGKVLRIFSAKGMINKGIDIAVVSSQLVKAAASGTVVYSGSGLLRYGNLVIIKHSDVFLSAYANNRKLWVTEGTVVTAGQKIAEIGSNEIEGEILHFEIRREGQPVDPLIYLP